MKSLFYFLVFVILQASSVWAGAETACTMCPVGENVRGHENVEWSIAYAYHMIDANKDLPRVLLVGDSICSAYQEGVQKALEGEVNVSYWISSYCLTSPGYKRLLGFYLDEAKYDVIHFNNGLHSLETETKAWAVALGEVLELIRQKQPWAKIVWASSTPLRKPELTAKARELNAAASEVIRSIEGISVNDLFSLADSYDRNEYWRDTYHHREPLVQREAECVVKAVRAALLGRAVSQDIGLPVRPGAVQGQPFWNGHSLWFMYPPAFDFKMIDGAAAYQFEVIDSQRKKWVTTERLPTAALTNVWAELPSGLTHVTCRGLDGKGDSIGLSGERKFWKQAPFMPDAYPKAARSYRSAAHKLIDFLIDGWKPAQVLYESGKPDPVYQYNCYPAKTGAALINTMVIAVKERPEKADKALSIARKEADFLMSVTPTNGPLAYFTPTYLFNPEAVATNRFAPKIAKRLGGQCMIRYSAEVGIALLRLAELTGEQKYADFAVRCGDTFLRLQRPDGTWPCVMRYSDGAAMRRDEIILIERVGFFTMLHKYTGDERYAKLENDVLAHLDRNQIKTWDWQGQFEDTSIDPEPYKDLTGTDALPAARYLLNRFPHDKVRVSQAREMIRFGEDQFVCWERPWHSDGSCPSSGQMVEEKWYDSTYASWFCPGVSEQYACMVPIDASACRMIWGYLALYRTTGDGLALAKARVLGDSLVNKQQGNGGIETYWYDTGMRFTDGCDEIDWLDCMADDVEALLELAEID